MCPSRSEWIRMGPNTSENFENLAETSKKNSQNFQKLREQFDKKNRERQPSDRKLHNPVRQKSSKQFSDPIFRILMENARQTGTNSRCRVPPLTPQRPSKNASKTDPRRNLDFSSFLGLRLVIFSRFWHTFCLFSAPALPVSASSLP